MSNRELTEIFKGMKARSAKKHQERLDRIKANPKAKKAFKGYERKMVKRAYVGAGLHGAAMGGNIAAQTGYTLRDAGSHVTLQGPSRQRVATGAALGAAVGVGATAAERTFWKKGPKKARKWYAKRTEKMAARHADPARLTNRVKYALQREDREALVQGIIEAVSA